ncbi:MAG: glc operon protein GlcG [Bermanella sp.]
MKLTCSTESISSDAAMHLVAAAVNKAAEINLAVAVAVVDTEGQLKAFHRMDRTPVIAVDTVQAKARAALLGLSTEELGEAMADSLPILLSMLTMKGITLLGGGLPIHHGGAVIGAIGVGGALTVQDVAIAEAALASLATLTGK